MTFNVYSIQFLTFLAIISFFVNGEVYGSIYSDTSKIECFRSWESLILRDSTATDVRNKFIDTLKKWKSMGLIGTNFDDLDSIQVDYRVCFNTNRHYCLLFVKRIPKNNKTKMVGIDFALGVLDDNKWNFYYADVTGFSIPRKKIKLRYKVSNVDFNVLSKYLSDVINTNYFLDDCKINDKFIEGHFNQYTKEKHQEFIEKSGSYTP